MPAVQSVSLSLLASVKGQGPGVFSWEPWARLVSDAVSEIATDARGENAQELGKT